MRYTNEDIEYLVENYNKKSIEEMQIERFNDRTVTGIKRKLYDLNLSKGQNGHIWTQEELNILLEHGGKLFDHEIQNMIPHISITQIGYKRRQLEIKGRPTIISENEKVEYKGKIFTLDKKNINYEARINGKNEYLHRVIMEDKIGRKLEDGEIVHHINGDHHDNDENNLYLYKNHSEHGKGHASLENTLMNLVKKGFIKFDKTIKKYYIAYDMNKK